MRTFTKTLCLSLILIVGFAGYTQADSINVSYFFDGLDLDLGKVELDPTVLLIEMGEILEELLRPDVAPLNDFKPFVDLSFDYDPLSGIVDFVLQNQVKIALLENGTFDEITSIPDNLEFTSLPLSIPIHSDTMLIAWTQDDRAFKLRFSQRSDLSIDVGFVKIYDGNVSVPEPSTFLLFGIGISGISVWLRRKTVLLLLALTIAFTCGTVNLANAQTDVITVIKQESTGDGTIVYGDQKCEPGCKEFTITYKENAAALLKAIPDSESRFVRWKSEDGRPLEGSSKAQPGDTIVALFQNKYELFTDNPYREGRPFDSDPTISRARYVQFFPNVLEDEGKVIFNLFDDVYLKAGIESIEKKSVTQYAWFGSIPDSKWSEVIIQVTNQSIMGNIWIDGRMYGIRFAGNGSYAVVEFNPRAFPKKAFLLSDNKPSQSANHSVLNIIGSAMTSFISLFTINEAHAQTIVVTPIDIMVVYTEDALNGAGSRERLMEEISYAITLTDRSFRNSGVNAKLRLVHTAQVDYTETRNLCDDVDRLRNPSDGFMDEIHLWRNHYGADLVSLWVEEEQDLGNNRVTVGCGSTMQTNSSASKNSVFSVVVRRWAGDDLTFAHELGHHMGAGHERTNKNPDGLYEYSHGYDDPNQQWNTIMSYGCRTCSPIPYWSNPDKTHAGNAMGIPEGDSNSADNRKTLNNTVNTVIDFRDTYLGGVNLWQYCRNHGYDKVYLANPNDPNSWRCQKRAAIDVTQACRNQYNNPNAYAEAKNWNDAFSWSCYATDGKKELGGVDLWKECVRTGYAGVTLISSDAGGWKCYGDNLSVTNACIDQYGVGAKAEARDWNNPYSWKCYRNGKELGGVDLWRECTRTGYNGVTLTGDDAGGWKCYSDNLSVNNACVNQYGPGAWSEAKDWNNEYSWTCYTKNKRELGGVDLMGECNRQGYNDLYLGNKNDAKSWECQKRDDINVTDACREEYQWPQAYANAYDPISAYSWGCYMWRNYAK